MGWMGARCCLVSRGTAAVAGLAWCGVFRDFRLTQTPGGKSLDCCVHVVGVSFMVVRCGRRNGGSFESRRYVDGEASGW
jgi:hypothetical protein